MILHGNGFDIEIWCPFDSRYDDIEFYVFHENKKYYGNAFTLRGLENIMKKDKLAGEALNGSYLWVMGLVILKEMSMNMLEEVVADLIKEKKDLGTIFSIREPAEDIEE
ncbi:MAG: hypothetical protein LBV67_03065 [Streptococcaceae bacterium]|jgi:hypothetical protein|nr:hypothetical protein [Streptococcaceae bacterium]